VSADYDPFFADSAELQAEVIAICEACPVSHPTLAHHQLAAEPLEFGPDDRIHDHQPVIWQAGQDYRMADAIQAARHQPTRTRRGPERVGPER
jgi:hypothetical protein